MQHWQPLRKQAGIAVFEILAVVVVIALIGGAGVYIAHQHKAKTSATTNTTNNRTDTATPGTLQYVDQVTNNAAAAEVSASSSSDSQYQQTATSSNTAMSNLGGAYNESTL